MVRVYKKVNTLVPLTYNLVVVADDGGRFEDGETLVHRIHPEDLEQSYAMLAVAVGNLSVSDTRSEALAEAGV